MNFGIYGILVIFVFFIIILIVNPNLSCFGRRVKSPFYPLFRKKTRRKKMKAEDYGFDLGAKGKKPYPKRTEKTERKTAAEDYGFDLRRERCPTPLEQAKHRQETKTGKHGDDTRSPERERNSVKKKKTNRKKN
jgi:hypothetical protein